MSYSSSPRKEVRFTGGEFTYNPNFLKTPLLQYTETQFSKYQLNKRAEKFFISNKKNEFAKFLDEIRLKNNEKANRRSKLLLQLSGKIIKDNPEQEFLISVKAEIEKVLKEFELKMEKERLLNGVLNSMENRICTKKQMALLEFNQLQRIITNFDLQLKTIDLQNSTLQAECKEMNRKLKEIQEQTFEEQLYCEDLLNIKKKTLNESEIEKTNVFEVYSQIKQNLIKGKTLFNNEKETLEALEKKYKANLQINNKIFEWLDDFDKIEKMFMIEKPNLNQQKSLLSLGIHQFSDNKIGENNINNNLNSKKSKFLAHKVKADGKVYSEIVKQIIKKKHQVEATASPEKTYNRKQIMERIQRFYNDHIDVPAFFTQMLNTYNKFCLTEKSLLTRIDDLNYQKKKLSDQLEEYKSICHIHESSLQTQLDQQTILHNEEFLLEDLKEQDNLIDIKKFDLNVIKKFEGFWFNCFLFLNETLYRFASMMKSIQIISGRKESFIIHEFTRIINNTRNYHHKFVSKETSPTNFQRSSNKHLSIKNSLTEINNNLSKKEEVLNLLISHFPNEKKNQLNEILLIIKKDFLIFFFIEIETLEEFIINTIKPLYEKKEKDLLKILEENLSKMKEQASSNFLNSFVNLLSKFSKIFGILQTDKGNKDFGFEKIINEFENKRKSTNISVPFKESKPKFEEIVIDDNIENEYISKLRKKSKLQETGSLLDSDEEENLKNSALNELKIDFDKKKLNEITNLLQNGTLNQQSVSLGRKFQDFARELIGNKTRVFPKIIKRYVMGKESRMLAEKARSTSRENKKYIKDYKEDSFEKTKIINENKQKNAINKNEYTELIGEINKIVKKQGKTSEVLQFFEIYKSYLSEIYTSISWNILMYVIRFGNLELFSYLWPIREKFENTSGYTYVHAACFGNELDMLKILVDEKKETVNPISLQISENTPLRFACKAGYLEQIEYLISRGAYYYDEVDGYCHNHIKYEINGEIKFKSFDGNDIPCGFIVSLTGNIPDTNIREYIRSLRFRNYSCVLKSLNMNKEEPKNKQIESISKILNYSKAKERIEIFMGIKREFSF